MGTEPPDDGAILYEGSPQAAQGRYIVTLYKTAEAVARDVAEVAADLARAYGGTVLTVYRSAIFGFAGEFDPAAAHRLLRDPAVEAMEADRYIQMKRLSWPERSRSAGGDHEAAVSFRHSDPGAGEQGAGLEGPHDDHGK
ncbi:MAG TPA: protease inhibitor I9 family protein [Actinokineospora sp.]|jgi:hypothetical protein|nr:protease inhibitor I9 family protein [Actinokineospora sp.]